VTWLCPLEGSKAEGSYYLLCLVVVVVVVVRIFNVSKFKDQSNGLMASVFVFPSCRGKTQLTHFAIFCARTSKLTSWERNPFDGTHFQILNLVADVRDWKI
jgi:hypothetical protein